jgi:hypothetical protein
MTRMNHKSATPGDKAFTEFRGSGLLRAALLLLAMWLAAGPAMASLSDIY